MIDQEVSVYSPADTAEHIEADSIKSVYGKILDKSAFDTFRAEQGFVDGFRGTSRSKEQNAYIYVKPGFTVESETQARSSLQVVEGLTAKGILYPGTKWGAYEENGRYQLFAVSRGLRVPATPEDQPEGAAHMLTRADVSNELGRPLEEHEWIDALLTREDSHVLDWYRRLDPQFNPQERPKNELAMLLNPFEASHFDNWGWDETTGKLYPVDIEVISIREPASQEIIQRVACGTPL